MEQWVEADRARLWDAGGIGAKSLTEAVGVCVNEIDPGAVPIPE